MSEDEIYKPDYYSEFWMKFQTGPEMFRQDPWTSGQRSIQSLREGRDPSIYGQVKNSYRTPSLIEWARDGKQYKVDVDTGICLIMEPHEFETENPYGKFTSIDERYHRMSDEEFSEVINYLQGFEDIKQSGLLEGIEERRKETQREETERQERKDVSPVKLTD